MPTSHPPYRDRSSSKVYTMLAVRLTTMASELITSYSRLMKSVEEPTSMISDSRFLWL